MRRERESGIELLRIVLMLMVCVLHTLIMGGVLESSRTTLSFYTFTAMRSLCICAVDGYALISGYFSRKRPFRLSKIIRLWFTVLFYSAGIACGIEVLHRLTSLGSSVGTLELIRSFLPVSYGMWYFTAYFALFFIAPFLDDALSLVDRKSAMKAFIVLFAVFTFPTLIQDGWFNNGYSAMWLIVLYILGALIGKARLFEDLGKGKLLLGYLCCCMVSFLLGGVMDFKNWGRYTSPSVLLSAVFLLLLFRKLKADYKIVYLVSPLTFGIYLFHVNDLIKMYFIEERFVFINDHSLPVGVAMVILCAVVIFTVSGFVDLFRTFLFKIFHIDTLSERIGEKVDLLIEGLASLFNRQ